jgi:hypothetical protein
VSNEKSLSPDLISEVKAAADQFKATWR